MRVKPKIGGRPQPVKKVEEIKKELPKYNIIYKEEPKVQVEEKVEEEIVLDLDLDKE